MSTEVSVCLTDINSTSNPIKYIKIKVLITKHSLFIGFDINSLENVIQNKFELTRH